MRQKKTHKKSRPNKMDGFMIENRQNQPKNAIRMPAATAEPITPETLLDMQ